MKTKINNSGIYKIEERKTGKVYIGSSSLLDYRKRNHFNLLRKNKHKNIYLQSSYNKYGEENFMWDILQYVDDANKLEKEEEKWISMFEANNKKHGFNLRDVCQNNSRVAGRGKIIKGENNHKAQAYHLINLNTLEEFKGVCVAEFCRQQKIKDASGYFVLKRGDIKRWKHFTTPEIIKKLPKYKFINKKSGEVIEGYFLKQLCLRNGLKPSAMAKVQCGRKKEHLGWSKWQ